MKQEGFRPALHPEPRRPRVAPAAMLYAMLAAPAGWTLEELVGWGLADAYCGGSSEATTAQLARGDMPAFIVLTLLGLALCASGAWVALRVWLRLRKRAAEAPGEQGAGRSRFTSLWALIASASFLAALLFQMVALWGAPLCPR